MLLRKKTKFLALALCSLIIVGFNVNDSSAARRYQVSDVVVSNLRVRKQANVNAPILYTLANGKDLVYSERPTDDGDSKRIWENFAYPDASQGKYTKSKVGWVCTWESGQGTDVTDTPRMKFHVSSWLYNNSSLTQKHKYISAGQYVINMDGPNKNIKHDTDNLNLWKLKTFNDNATTGDSPKTRYFDGWLANAIK